MHIANNTWKNPKQHDEQWQELPGSSRVSRDHWSSEKQTPQWSVHPSLQTLSLRFLWAFPKLLPPPLKSHLKKVYQVKQLSECLPPYLPVGWQGSLRGLGLMFHQIFLKVRKIISFNSPEGRAAFQPEWLHRFHINLSRRHKTLRKMSSLVCKHGVEQKQRFPDWCLCPGCFRGGSTHREWMRTQKAESNQAKKATNVARRFRRSELLSGGCGQQ